MDIFIYVLKDPITNEVKYVGKTNNIRLRWNQHKSDNRIKINKVKSWIKSLVNKGYLPIMEQIELCDEQNWREREQYWIDYYTEQGCSLKNMVRGGMGITSISEEMKKHLSILNKGKKYNYEHPKRKQVHMYSLDGHYIESFASLTIAAKKLNTFVGNIISAIKRNRSSVGYMWSYNKLECLPPYSYVNDVTNAQKARLNPVLEIDKNGVVINEFSSINDAFNKTKLHNISAVCRGVRKSTQGRFFKYKTT